MRMPAHCRSEADTELAEVFNELRTGFEADGVHTGFPGACDKTFHVIDKNGFLRPELDLPQDAAVDLEIGFARAHLMRREFPVEMPEQFEMLFDVGVMHVVGVRDQVKRVMFLDPREQLVHPRIFPEDVVPIIFERFIRNRLFKDAARFPVELRGRDLASRVGLLELGKKEMRPDPDLGNTAGRGEPPRGFLDVVIHEHVAEIEDDGFDFFILGIFHRRAL